MLHVWNICLQNWAIFVVNAGESSSTMEQATTIGDYSPANEPHSPLTGVVWMIKIHKKNSG